MFEIFQEAELPKLTQTSLYIKFDKVNKLTSNIIEEINNSNQTRVKPESIPEIISLMKLNGDSIVKRAIKNLESGNIVIINNKETSKIPPSLPFVVISQKGVIKAYVFADKIVNKINSPQEYTNLMAVIEAAYLARALFLKPSTFLMNRPLVLTLCDIYTRMVIAPLEQKLYMKGDNLVKAILYTIAYFYRMIDGNNISAGSIPYKRLVPDKLDPSLFKQIVEDIKSLPDLSFLNFLDLIIKINPVRYKDLKTIYITHFVSTCGIPLMFALENLGYLFLLVTSAQYKTPVTSYTLNRYVGMNVKKLITLITPLNLN